MGFFQSAKRFGGKVAGAVESGARFGQKVLGGVARFGDKVQQGAKDLQRGIANAGALGAVADMPVFKGHSVNTAIGAVGAAAGAGAGMARAGQEVLKQGENIVRTGRGIAGAGSVSQAGAIADDMMRQGRSAAQASKALGQQIQKLRP
tara:strand:+ start:3270 stop:3713 length:444 start_codon:yes stop_codon:yes gene_type:complete